MHCIIVATESGSVPRSLRPMKRRAVIDYSIEDALLQPEISHITVSTSKTAFPLISKHIRNAFPTSSIQVVIKSGYQEKSEDDTLTLVGEAYTSLKLQDFIRFFRQHKTVVMAAYDKQNPKKIPFTITPQNVTSLEARTYNCGTGFCYL